MRKLFSLLTAVFFLLFAQVSFSQDYMIGGLEVGLSWVDTDGTQLDWNHNLSISCNPTNRGNITSGGIMTIIFDELIDFVEIFDNQTIMITEGTLKELTLSNGGVYGVQFEYTDFNPGVFAVRYNGNAKFPIYSEQDTINSYNNGYDDGYLDGSNSSTGTNIMYDDVKNLNVYPNPINTTEYVNIDCDNFNNVKVYTTDGQQVHLSYDKRFPINDFTNTKGIFLLKVEDDDFNTKSIKLVVE